MKKALIIMLILAAAGYGIYYLSIPESRKIQDQIEKIRTSSLNEAIKDVRIHARQRDLMNAWMDENNPDAAIRLIEMWIRLNRSEYMGSPGYQLEAIYFNDLAAAYELKGDRESVQKAKKKAAAAEARAKKLEAREPKAKSLLD